MAKVWVVTGESESGDHYGPWVVSEKPDEQKLRQIASHCDWPEGEDEGPGDFGSYTFLTVFKCELDSDRSGREVSW